ncbi:MAG: efflux transporter periplasmic adaptor subunit [Verrucomicrobia bacterium]|nr:MAG: efflux transporter periplasmic adaptor subunit [Verrucomicrobiota bacterium]
MRNIDQMIHRRLISIAVFGAELLSVLLFAASCSRKPAQVAPNAPEVLVTTVKPQDVPRVLERVATLDGFINANINAQVQGYIVSRDYKEGSVVKKGDLLFQIDPRPFEAALAQAKGTLAKDQATRAKTDADEKRALDLFSRKVISDQERDTAIAAAGSSRANVEADEAAVKQTELNLGYTKVTSPIDGVAAIATAQVGDLVGPSTGSLTTVSQLDPIKAVVTAGEGPFTDFISRHPDPDERQRYVNSLEFDLILSSGNVYPQKGKFYALDRNLDPKTGSIRYEVTFPNPANALRPGQFGKVRFIADMKKGAMVVPQEAVNELQGSFQVAVVDQDNKVSIRPVKMGERIGALWEVTDGLKPGERIIVQGAQKAREGSTVNVKDWTSPAPQVASDGLPASKNP